MQCQSGIYPAFVFRPTRNNNLNVSVGNKFWIKNNFGYIAGSVEYMHFVNIK